MKVLKTDRITGRKLERGQVIAEYVMVLVMVISISITLLLLMAVLSEYGWRITALVGDEPY